jgi:hypothetical protein
MKQSSEDILVDEFLKTLEVFLRITATDIVEETKDSILQDLLRGVFTEDVDQSEEVALMP